MIYAEYPGHKTYVIIENDGFGVIEDPMREVGPVSSFDTLEEAQEERDKLIKALGKDWKSWETRTSYSIHVNKLTKEGQAHIEQLRKDFNDYIKDSTYSEHQIGGLTIWMKSDPLDKNENPVQSFRMDVLDFSKNNEDEETI